MDITSAFDTIKQDEVINIVADMLDEASLTCLVRILSDHSLEPRLLPDVILFVTPTS